MHLEISTYKQDTGLMYHKVQEEHEGYVFLLHALRGQDNYPLRSLLSIKLNIPRLSV
jgi:hypothetical protein